MKLSLISIAILIAIITLSGCTGNINSSNETEIIGNAPDELHEEPDPICGNNECETGETRATCSADCGVNIQTIIICGNNICEKGENEISCSQDCLKVETHFECQSQACVEVQGTGVDQCQIDSECVTELRTASVLEVPLPENSKCFWQRNGDLPECTDFYDGEFGDKVMACPKFYNPVFDSDGTFYPSACWAEQLGVMNYQYGYSTDMTQFISDLFWVPRDYSYKVPSPDIEFSYDGGLLGSKNGVFLRSVLWIDDSDFIILDYDIDTEQGTLKKQNVPYSYKRETLTPVYAETLDVLIVFVKFDDIYPEQILLDWTETYSTPLNDYIKNKQEVENPIQFNFVPVVIEPPDGVERPSQTDLFFLDKENQLMYDAAINKIGRNDFQILTIAPVSFDGYGGYYTSWNGMHYIDAALSPREAYSNTDKQKGLDSLAEFQFMFITISHEILHSVGLPGDHVPMGYGTLNLSFTSSVDPITGYRVEDRDACEFFTTSPDYYAVELPNNLKIFVGQEPDWLFKNESPTDSCLSGIEGNNWLKDFDNDGEYEIMYSNNLIGVELQRSLGWTDIDGDGITELIDSDAYGGYTKNTGYTRIGQQPRILGSYGFEPLQEVTIEGCRFEEVELENQQIGYVPLECVEFNDDIVNIYKDVKYNWLIIEKDFGNVFLPRMA